MDELNELKKIWDRSFEKEPKAPDREKLAELVNRRSSSPVGKLKKSLRIEIGAILIAIPLLVAILFRLTEPYFLFNTGILIAVFTSSLVYYFHNLRRLEKIWHHSQENIHQSIRSTLMLVKFFRKVYFWMNLILFPFGIYFGYIVGFGLGSDGQRVSSLPVFENLPFLMALSLIGLIIVVLFGLFYVFLKWYVKKLYDVHINKLEEIDHELTEFE
ncbi:MAG: hypothetical protein K0B37_08985 [Bacteroidales bacterium]|nr:hypothetical protein [Bacteroidales bacterium]